MKIKRPNDNWKVDDNLRNFQRLQYTLVVESCPVEIRPLFENPGNLKPGKKNQGEL